MSEACKNSCKSAVVHGGEQSAENDLGEGDSIVIDRGECKHDETEDTDDPGVYTSLKKFTISRAAERYIFR